MRFLARIHDEEIAARVLDGEQLLQVRAVVRIAQIEWDRVLVVVQAAHDDRTIRVAVFKRHEHLVPGPWQVKLAPSVACHEVRQTDPICSLVFTTAPVKLHLYPAVWP